MKDVGERAALGREGRADARAHRGDLRGHEFCEAVQEAALPVRERPALHPARADELRGVADALDHEASAVGGRVALELVEGSVLHPVHGERRGESAVPGHLHRGRDLAGPAPGGGQLQVGREARARGHVLDHPAPLASRVEGAGRAAVERPLHQLVGGDRHQHPPLAAYEVRDPGRAPGRTPGRPGCGRPGPS